MYIIISISVFEITFFLVIKPLLKKAIQETVYKLTDSIYDVEFQELRVNLLTGGVLMTDFSLLPNLNYYYSKKEKLTENFYKIHLDSLIVLKIRLFKLIGRKSTLKLTKLELIRPEFTVLGVNKDDSLNFTVNNKVSYDTVRNDIINSIFKVVKSIEIKKFIIKDGNLDFLKPDLNNQSSFNIESITLIVNNFYATKKIFDRKSKKFFSDDLEIFINGYQLRLNDNIHVFGAKKLYINSKAKEILMSGIYLKPAKKLEKYIEIDSNILDFSIIEIKLERANFREIYTNNQLHLSKATIDGMTGNIYSQMKSPNKKLVFNRDSIKAKVDVYYLFKKYLNMIQIDTVDITNGVFNQYSRINQKKTQTSIASFNLFIRDFLIDSVSINDTNRVLYSKELSMNIFGFNTLMKDGVHSLSAESVVLTLKNQGLYAKNIRIKSNELLQLYAQRNHISFNNFYITAINISGLNFKRFVHNDQIDIKQILISNSNFDIKSNGKAPTNEKTQPFFQIFQNFAKKIDIKKIIIPSGNIKYIQQQKDKNTYLSLHYKASIDDFSLNPYTEQVTKFITVGAVDAVFSKLIFNTSDSLYSVRADSLYYSSKKSIVRFANIKLEPIKNGLYKRLQKYNRTFTFKIEIPIFSITNTNLNLAFEADSLSLKEINILNPTFELTTYPGILLKNTKKKLTNTIKRRAINKLIRQSTNAEVIIYSQTPNIDSISYSMYKLKRDAIDTISKNAVHEIIGLNISANDLRQTDTTIDIINKILNITTLNISLISEDSLSKNDLKNLLSSTLIQIRFIVNNYNAPKVDKEEIFHLIGQYLPKINSDTLVIKDGIIKYNSFQSNVNKVVFQTNFDLKLYNFNFDTLFIDSTKRVLFSDNFVISVNNMIINMKDSIHKIKINDVTINSEDSSIRAKEFNFYPENKSDKINLINFKIQDIILNGVDFRELYFFHNFLIREFYFKSPDLKISLPNKKAVKKEVPILIKLFLPSKLKKVSVQKIYTNKGHFKVNKINTKLAVEGNFSFGLFDFVIDSVTTFSENKYFLPIENFEFKLENFKYLSEDSNTSAFVKNIKINTIESVIKFDRLFYTNFTADSSKILKYVKIKNRINLLINSIIVYKLDIPLYRYKQKIAFKSIKIDSPQLILNNLEPEVKKKQDLADINIYKLINKNVKKLIGDEFSINNLKLNINVYTDSSIVRSNFNNLNLLFNRIMIDSTTLIHRPNLFYSEDVKFELNNFEKIQKDGIYKIKVATLSGSTKSNIINAKDVQYVPIMPIEKVQENFQSKITAMSITAKTVTVKSLDFYQLVFKNKLIARQILADTMVMINYTDRNYPHENKIKPHLIEKVLDFPVLLDVKSALITNVTIFYTEIEQSNQVAKVKLGNGEIRVLNILNDTAKINAKDIYTIIKTKGLINDSAEITFNVFYQLSSRGNIAKVQGEIGECNASVFNSYTVNGINLLLEKGVFHRIAFDFKIHDTLSIGKMRMEYNDLKVYLLTKDTTNMKKKRLMSWLADVFLVKNDNPKYGIYSKLGSIAYIHNRTYSDVKLWIRSILSGVQSTIAFDPKDAKKIRKIMQKNKRKIK